MTSPPNAPPPGHEDRAGEQDDLADRSPDYTPWPYMRLSHSPVQRYLRRREAVLGRRVFVPLGDPSTGAGRLAEALGGRIAARAWLRAALDELTRL